jgi:hypothetical protein
VTGTSLALTEAYAKGLELSRVAVLFNPDTPSHEPCLRWWRQPAAR